MSIFVLCFCSCGVLRQFGTAKDSSEIEVSPEMELNYYEKTIASDESFQLEVVSATSGDVKWKSSNENVVLVNSQGKVTAVNAGVANVTCYIEGGKEAVCTVTVTEKENNKTYSSQTSSIDDSFIFPHSSTAYLSEQEVEAKLSSMSGKALSGEFAQDAINEIYARNGYVFKKSHLSAYYSTKSWYTPNASFSTADFNTYEKKNIALLKTFL